MAAAWCYSEMMMNERNGAGRFDAKAYVASELNEHDFGFLRRALELAQAAKASGRHPFGALVVDANGTIVAEAGNDSLLPDGDPTRHAELVAAAMAARKLSLQELSASTLYANVEPCAMCAGAIYWCGIGRVVYAMSERALHELAGDHPENPTLSLPCREVFARGRRGVEAVGPVSQLKEEAARLHLGFWSGDA